MATIIVFDLRGPLAHFRRPDTLGTHATYPFITRTALRGLAASILGLPAVPSEVRCGIRLLAPVRTVVQELTMHGKTWVAASGRADSFHRPTAIELVVQPHYRIFYKGPLSDELSRRLKSLPEPVPHLPGQRLLPDVSCLGGGARHGGAAGPRSGSIAPLLLGGALTSRGAAAAR